MRFELCQRLEREQALVQARMRHLERRLVDLLVAVQQQVEVDGPRAETRALARTAEAPLDPKENDEEPASSDVGLERGGGVQESRLVDDPDRRRIPETGDGGHMDAR